MMETKWAPGPWKTVKAYGHEPEHIYWDVRPKDSGWESVATAWCSEDPESRITREAMDANAHLIAAAPELYAALEAIMIAAIGPEQIIREQRASDVFESIDDAASRARAVLAKARGEKE